MNIPSGRPATTAHRLPLKSSAGAILRHHLASDAGKTT
jgi:hypothetical protein